MDSIIDEVCSDFKNSLAGIDFNSYNPNSAEFISALNVGLMWNLLQELKGEKIENVSMSKNSESEKDEISDELFGAKKYFQKYLDSSDMVYKDMASDELKHAEILIKKAYSKLPNSEEKAKLKMYEDEHSQILKQIESE